MKVRIRFIRKVLWDNWGHYVTAFKEGDVVDAEVHTYYDGTTYTAESPYFPGISDIVYSDDFKVVRE